MLAIMLYLTSIYFNFIKYFWPSGHCKYVLLPDPDSTEKYKGLKARFLGTFTPYDYERAGMLIKGLDLGDDKPFALMDRMLALLGDHEDF